MGVLLDTEAGTSQWGMALLEALLALVLVAALAWLVLKFIAARAVVAPKAGKLVIEERVMLDMKSSLLVVRVGGRRLLVSAGEGGPPRLLTELDPEAASPRSPHRSAPT
jgi:flagellar biogenesis protein FliO